MPKTSVPIPKQTLFVIFWEQMRGLVKKTGSIAVPAATWMEQTAQPAFAPILVRQEPNGTASPQPVITGVSAHRLPPLLVINKAVNTFVTKIGFNAEQLVRITPAQVAPVVKSMKPSIARTGLNINPQPDYALLRIAQRDALKITVLGNASHVRRALLTVIWATADMVASTTTGQNVMRTETRSLV